MAGLFDWTRTTLLFTVVSVGLLPSLSLFQQRDVSLIQASVLVVGLVAFLAVHSVRLWRAIRGRWEPFPAWQTSGLVAFTVALSLYATSITPETGALWGVVTGLAASEFIIGRGRREAWLPIWIAAAAQAIVLVASSPWLGLVEAGMVVIMALAVGTAFRQWEGALKPACRRLSWPPPGNGSGSPRTCTTSWGTRWKWCR
jgi:hypothetical protein